MTNYNIHPLAFSAQRYLLARSGIVIPPLRLVSQDVAIPAGHFIAVNSLPAKPFPSRVVAGHFRANNQYRAEVFLAIPARFGATDQFHAEIYLARFVNVGHFSQTAGLSGTPHRDIWWLREQPTTAQLIYHCTLTGAADGLEDIVLRISNFQYRLYDHGGSYLSVTVPDATAHAARVAARRNGQLIIRRGLRYADGGRDLSEIVRAGKLEMRYNTGARSSSLTITAGDSISFATDPGAIRSTNKIISRGLQADGSQTFQIEPLNGVYPNTEIWLAGEKHLIKRVSVAIGGRVSQMNLLTEPA